MLAGALITASRLDLEIKVDKEPIAQPSASFRFPIELSCPQFILGSRIAANGMTDRVASNGASLDRVASQISVSLPSPAKPRPSHLSCPAAARSFPTRSRVDKTWRHQTSRPSGRVDKLFGSIKPGT